MAYAVTFDLYILPLIMSWQPWTSAAKRVARMKGHKRKPVKQIKDWKIVRGDLVCRLEMHTYV